MGRRAPCFLILRICEIGGYDFDDFYVFNDFNVFNNFKGSRTALFVIIIGEEFSIDMGRDKRVGLRHSREEAATLDSRIMLEADRWLKTVQQIRGTGKVCKKGFYRFGTFEEADQWMEAMILRSSQGSQL